VVHVNGLGKKKKKRKKS